MPVSQWLLEEITTRLVSTTTHAEHLRTQLAEAEDDLERLRIAEQVVKEIVAGRGEVPETAVPGVDGRGERSSLAAGDDTGDDVVPMYQVALAAARVAEPAPGGLLIPYRHQAQDVRELPADYQALLAAVRTAGGPMICKAICEHLGLTLSSGQVEGVRDKLNRPAER